METEIELIAKMTVLNSLTGKDALSPQEIVWRGGGEWGPETPYTKMFNPDTLETIAGEVLSVEMITPIKVMSYGVQLTLQADTETISIHLGPGWYIENQDIKIVPRDKIEIKGSRITFEDKPVIIATEVIKDEDVLVLRDATGCPVWSGWKRRGRS